MFRERDREREEPYGRNRRPPPAEPYHDRRGNGREEPYRREPYPEREREREREREPYHEPYPRERPTPPPPPPPPPPSNPIECEIVVMSRTIREYGEYIDKRLRELGLSTGILFLAEEASLQQALDDITRRHCLYAVVTNVQNEAHRSMTLNILHGTPQEHRNMPLEDALSLVARNFAEFGKERRERQQPAAAVAARPAVPPVVPPVDNSINHLLGMLSDSKYLSVEQLGRVIAYLEDRRLRQAEIEGHPLAASNHAGSARSLPGAASAAAAPAAVVENPNDLLKQQQELQAKILSVLNKPAANPPMSGGNKAAQPPAPSYGNYGGAQPQTPTSVAGINLDNPNIQKAIDNLINSGPRLLQNLTSVSSQSASTLSEQDAPTSTQQPAVPNPAPSIHSAVAPQQQQQWRPLVQWPKQQAQVASRPPHVLQQQQQQHHQQQQHQQQQHQQQRHHQQQQQIQQQQMQQQQMQQQQQHNDELQQGGLGLLGDAPNAYMY
ncbi:PREDICTED: nuclear receptor coactivator 5-like [Priapulus caudatus]|uniref:Nuclear receptor coactivator 5-like n=1 Tax=Priapulus caudatus TaxID=37621 RepID=A0ABM1ECA4_PRICU|nr:PREDICTED: nuclear receptor coactivator 5-like [Priapulus caudatus]